MKPTKIGSQLRRSAGSAANIVEGYGKSSYKQEYIRFLILSHASKSETLFQIAEVIHLYPEINENLKTLYKEYDVLEKVSIKICNM